MTQIKEQQMQKNITSTAYNGLEELYNYLNDTFFEGKLPSCLITLQRTARFSADRACCARAVY